jgi:phage baseplate assembly protein W
MSFDRQIDQICEHRVREEGLYVEPDFRTVKPIRPVAASVNIQVRFDGEILVPSQGVYVAAQCTGAKNGPFTVQAGVNDTLILQVGEGTPQVTVFPPSYRMTSKMLAHQLNLRFQGVSFSDSGQRVQVQSSAEGRSATMRFLPGSTFASTIGFPVQRVWQGRTIVPGWSVVADPSTLPDRPMRWVVFDEPLQGFSDWVELDYTTVRQECRRCGGLGVENDWRYSKSGDVVTVQDEALLIQEIQKILYTLVGSNPFHTWYGSSLIDAVGNKISSTGVVQNLINSEVIRAFRKWQAIKNKQEQEVGQYVSDEEYPFQLLGVQVTQSQADPTVVLVSITLQNRSSKPIQILRGVKMPNPDDLLSSTAAQGVIRQSLVDYTLIG